ncbi:MAG: glutathione synthase [Gammaproteobacteria bacterium]|nr:glutathione synthase [Gammaproteobacteria bacterium]
MIKLGVVMDPMAFINAKKDSTLAMLLEAQSREWQLFYMEQGDLFLRDGTAYARMRELSVQDDLYHWFDCADEAQAKPLADLDVILMRKDPPFDMEYIYTTYLLENAEAEGVLVVNKPQSLRDVNEKVYTTWFPQCCTPTLVSRNADQLRDFLFEHGDIILKPLDAMGGASVFRVREDDPNINVIIETLTRRETRFIMAQRYIPEINAGDKRILLIDGRPVPFALARIAAPGETRANLAAGGRGEGVPLSERDLWICEQVGPILREKGLIFVGLDVIGDYLTEINVTSPTCIRELDAIYDLNISGWLMDCIETRLAERKHS